MTKIRDWIKRLLAAVSAAVNAFVGILKGADITVTVDLKTENEELKTQLEELKSLYELTADTSIRFANLATAYLGTINKYLNAKRGDKQKLRQDIKAIIDKDKELVAHKAKEANKEGIDDVQ